MSRWPEQQIPVGFVASNGHLCGIHLVPYEESNHLPNTEPEPPFEENNMDKWDSPELREWIEASLELDEAIFSCIKPNKGEQE